jgi:hypothetical protein
MYFNEYQLHAYIHRAKQTTQGTPTPQQEGNKSEDKE